MTEPTPDLRTAAERLVSMYRTLGLLTPGVVNDLARALDATPRLDALYLHAPRSGSYGIACSCGWNENGTGPGLWQEHMALTGDTGPKEEHRMTRECGMYNPDTNTVCTDDHDPSKHFQLRHPGADVRTCVFVPPHEPWDCSTHNGVRTSLDDEQCDIARPAEPFNDARLDIIRQAIAEGRNPSSRYVTRRLLATIDALRSATPTEPDGAQGRTVLYTVPRVTVGPLTVDRLRELGLAPRQTEEIE